MQMLGTPIHPILVAQITIMRPTYRTRIISRIAIYTTQPIRTPTIQRIMLATHTGTGVDTNEQISLRL